MTTHAPIRIGFARRTNVTLSEAWRVFAPPAVEGPAFVFPTRKAATSLLAMFLCAPAIAVTQPSHSTSPAVLDRAIAVVNKHLILASDLDDEMRLSILDPNLVGGKLTPRQALEDLISRALVEQQMRQEDAQSIEPTQSEVNARLQQLRRQLPACVHENCASDAGWNIFLSAHGLAPQHVEAYARYRIEILSFIERRFRQGIQISQEQIAAYYRDTLLPQYKPGDTVPTLDQVAERIQEILLQQQVNQLFDTWLANLRQQGDVEILDPSLESAGPQGNAERVQP